MVKFFVFFYGLQFCSCYLFTEPSLKGYWQNDNNIPTQDPPAEGTSVNFFSKHKRNVRKSLAPGVIAILLAGVHKGKRVIVLKQLKTGLLLVTGPHKVNGVPLRRVNQRFMLATSTKIDVSGVEVPNKINDQYFARLKKTTKKEDGDISEAKKIEELKEKREAERKSDQATVDKQVMAALAKNEEGKALKKYLKASFSLRKGQFPHKMAF